MRKRGFEIGLALWFLSLPLIAQTPGGGNLIVEGSYLNANSFSRETLDLAGNYGLPIPQIINVRADLDAEVGSVGPMDFSRYRIQLGPQLTHREDSFKLTLHALAGATRHRWSDINRNRTLLFQGGSAMGPVVTLGGKIDTDYELIRVVRVREIRLDVSPAWYAGRWHREYRIGCRFTLKF